MNKERCKNGSIKLINLWQLIKQEKGIKAQTWLTNGNKVVIWPRVNLNCPYHFHISNKSCEFQMHTKASSNEFSPSKTHSTIKIGACKRYILKLA